MRCLRIQAYQPWSRGSILYDHTALAGYQEVRFNNRCYPHFKRHQMLYGVFEEKDKYIIPSHFRWLLRLCSIFAKEGTGREELMPSR